MIKIGDILKNTREDKDITQLQVMKKTGISNKALSRYENNITEPDLETLIKLFRFYGISADKVFGLEKNSDTSCYNLSSTEYRIITELRQMDTSVSENILTALTAINNKN